MEQPKTNEDVFKLGTWLGRQQALGLVAGRCTFAELECLAEVYENKLYLALEPTWEDYCRNRLSISRRTAERLLRTYRDQGPLLARLNCFNRIKPKEYVLFAALLSEDGLSYDGEIIGLEPQNAPGLAQAVQAIRERSAPAPIDPQTRAFARAEKLVQAAVAQFTTLESMDLGQEGKLKLTAAVQSARDQIDRIRLSA